MAKIYQHSYKYFILMVTKDFDQNYAWIIFSGLFYWHIIRQCLAISVFVQPSRIKYKYIWIW